jgi:tetratricopeptide (TPR) repeat protein
MLKPISIVLFVVFATPGSAFGQKALEKAVKYWQSGYQKQKSGDHAGAIADYGKAIKADPTYMMGYSSRASERIEVGDYDGAIADSTKCIEITRNAQDMMCYGIRARAFKAKGDVVSADNDSKKVSDGVKEWAARNDAIRSSAKHYTDGQSIPGVGTAIGDVYILPDGGCFGDKGSGIHWTTGATSYFGSTVSAQSPLRLVQPGSPATKQ